MDKKDNTFGINLRYLRKAKGLSGEQLAKKLNISSASVSQWENGKTFPSTQMLMEICKLLNVNSSDLYTPHLNEMDEDDYNYMFNSQELPSNTVGIKKIKIPILGEIACGHPIYASGTVDSYVAVSSSLKADFALWAKGDSMIDARIYDGDLVYIKSQSMVENGEIAAVEIDDEATLKRVYYDQQKGIMTLVSANPKYPPFVYSGEELKNVRILGKAITFQGLVK